MSTSEISKSLKRELARQLATGLHPLRNREVSTALAAALEGYPLADGTQRGDRNMSRRLMDTVKGNRYNSAACVD